MSTVFDIAFAKSASIDGGLVVQLKLAGETAAAGASEADPANVAARAAGIAKFKAKAFSTLDILAPQARPPIASSSLVSASRARWKRSTG